ASTSGVNSSDTPGKPPNAAGEGRYHVTVQRVMPAKIYGSDPSTNGNERQHDAKPALDRKPEQGSKGCRSDVHARHRRHAEPEAFDVVGVGEPQRLLTADGEQTLTEIDGMKILEQGRVGVDGTTHKSPVIRR